MKAPLKALRPRYYGIAIMILGVACILFPREITRILPFLLGVLLVLQGMLSLYGYHKTGGSLEVNPGRCVVLMILGVVIFCMDQNAIHVLGVIWALLSLNEAADVLSRMMREKKIGAVRLVSVIITVILAVVLITDPSEHFVFHVRVLGLEMILSILEDRSAGPAAGHGE